MPVSSPEAAPHLSSSPADPPPPAVVRIVRISSRILPFASIIDRGEGLPPSPKKKSELGREINNLPRVRTTAPRSQSAGGRSTTSPPRPHSVTQTLQQQRLLAPPRPRSVTRTSQQAKHQQQQRLLAQQWLLTTPPCRPSPLARKRISSGCCPYPLAGPSSSYDCTSRY